MEYRVKSPDGQTTTYGTSSENQVAVAHSRRMGWDHNSYYITRVLPTDVPEEDVHMVYRPRYKTVRVFGTDNPPRIEIQGRIVCYIVHRNE